MDSRTGSRELGARRGQGLPHKSRLGLPVPLTGIREAPHSLNLSERGRVVCAWAANSVKSILGRCSLPKDFFPRLGPGIHRQEVMEARLGAGYPEPAVARYSQDCVL